MDCLFVEYWWTPGDMSQGADRIYRIGQTRGVMIRILHAPSTFDDFVRSALKRKRSVIDCFNDRTILDVEDV
jgi:SNF2 family DNA or RNA helicase